MEKEKQWLLLCCKVIENQLNWGDSEAWSNDDFERLSELIFEKTKVRLSISTLKRIWGKVKYENFPTTATLNALTGFLGYKGWREFKQQNETPGSANAHKQTTEKPAVNQPAKATNRSSGSFANKLAMGVIVFIFITSVLFEVFSHLKTSIDPSKIKFTAAKVSDTLPNSVIFNYDASVFHSDSVFIQQSWDPQRRERVAGKGHKHTSVYFNPGYFTAKLIVDGRVEKQYPVFIKTKGWKGIIEKQPVPVYLSDKEIKTSEGMGITPELLQEKTGSPVFNNQWVNFADVRDFSNIDADNFTCEATVKNTSAVEASVCRRINVVILAKNTAIVIPLADKGCISDINILAGGRSISGKDHDLSAFGCNFNHWQNLKCTVSGRRLSVLLNGKEILEANDGQDLGQIVGLRFEFEGSGVIKQARLFSPGKGNYDFDFLKN